MSSPPPEKSSFLPDLSSYSPWGSRNATPKPRDGQGSNEERAQSPVPKPQRGGDHAVSLRHALSSKSYPRDCPPLAVQWYHAVDAPKRKPPTMYSQQSTPEKPLPAPKKYVPFSENDSRAIEAAFQKWAEREEGVEIGRLFRGAKARNSSEYSPSDSDERAIKVPVNEDYLFDVDIEKRELMPTYWLGPVYDVRRGTWFFQDGANLRPCDENLATQLEEGYLKVQPWKTPVAGDQRSSSQPRTRPNSISMSDSQKSSSNPITPKLSTDDLKSAQSKLVKTDDTPPTPDPPRAFRLFGAHMGSVVTYQSHDTAWLVTDDFLSRMSGTVFERIAGGAHFAGTKIVRGFLDTSKKPELKGDKASDLSRTGSKRESREEVAEEPNESEVELEGEENELEKVSSPSENRRINLERQLSSLVDPGANDPEKQEEEVRKRDEKEMRDDYKELEGDEQGRDIEHLILVTHGIGQRLGVKLESINFIHDVNTMRKTFKTVYNESTDLQALNNEIETPTKNCRVQVLPVSWRHLLDFPKQSLKHIRQEFDLGELDDLDEEYPSLDDITVEGVPAVRNLITDLGLDILLYQSPAYKGHITRIVLQESNRIYKLFKQRNPNFNGKISLMGHSLGSAILFDILCNQKVDEQSKRNSSFRDERKEDPRLQLDFEVEDFYALGSPIGLFQMLKGRRLAARHTPGVKPAQTPWDIADDSYFEPPVQHAPKHSSTYIDITTSSPKCARVFNIFHPTDPIAYRLEPLISPAMAGLKPQPLPYTKKGIFGAPAGQGLTGIGARVGQSVSGFWSSISGGIASSLLNRSLGITSEEAIKLAEQQQKSRAPLSMAAGTNISAGGVVSPPPTAAAMPGNAEPMSSTRPVNGLHRKLTQNGTVIEPGEDGAHPPTLIDNDLETLYSGFQKRRISAQHTPKSSKSSNPLDESNESPFSFRDYEEQGRKLRREEQKIRALNENGRVDYSIQEGAFDISILASIASHLSYWADEDVSHFVISQLLARHRVLRR